MAILKYIAKKAGRDDLLGKTPECYAMEETYLGIANDIWNTVSPATMSDNYKTELPVAYEKIKEKLIAMEKNIVGPTCLNYFTVADLKLVTVLVVVFKIYKEQTGEFKRLQKLITYVEKLPQIKQYRQKGVTRLLPPQAKITID
jgi:glutathione S-transferase